MLNIQSRLKKVLNSSDKSSARPPEILSLAESTTVCLHVHACVYLVSECAAHLIESLDTLIVTLFFVFLWFSFSSFTLVVSRLRGPFRKREVHTCPHSQERKNCVSWFFSFLVNIVHCYIYTLHESSSLPLLVNDISGHERKVVLFFRHILRTVLLRSFGLLYKYTPR